MTASADSEVSAICLDLATCSPHQHCCSHHLRWQWVHHCCIQSSEQCDHITCSCCNTHWNVLTYNDILKEHHIAFWQSDNWQKNTFDSESELHWCTTTDEFSSELMWYSLQTKHCHWAKWEWSLSERSEHTKQAAVDQQREQNWHQCSQKWEWQHECCTRWELYKLSALRHILVWHLHDDVVVVVVAAELVIQESVLKYSIKEISHTRSEMKKLKKKKKRFEVRKFITHFTDR
jgi:hypothetical protein